MTSTGCRLTGQKREVEQFNQSHKAKGADPRWGGDGKLLVSTLELPFRLLSHRVSWSSLLHWKADRPGPGSLTPPSEPRSAAAPLRASAALI